MNDKPLIAPLTRRNVLGATCVGSIALAGIGLVPSLASASAKRVSDVMGMLSDFEALPKTGRIRLSIPSIYKNGNSVPLTVEVDNPMTESDYVSRIHVVAPGNPFPEVASFYFTPFSGKASASTRIRLDAGKQAVLATAELSDGSVLSTSASVRITVGGCTS